METMKLFGRGFLAFGLILAAVLLAGCDTTTSGNDPRYDPLGLGPDTNSPEVLVNTNVRPKAVSSAQTHYKLRVGDDLVVTILDTPPPPIPPIQDTVRDNGTITLIHSQEFKAAGMSITELQKAIHERYVSNYYNSLTANITLANRFYYVIGEVMQPNRVPYAGPIKVVEAINTAGGPTLYANMSNVTVTRDSGEVIKVNCNKAKKDSRLNIEIFPGDRIEVGKSLW
jgi:polysaccharide biosynthesis/export protein